MVGRETIGLPVASAQEKTLAWPAAVYIRPSREAIN
jgi:hypothetical protein